MKETKILETLSIVKNDTQDVGFYNLDSLAISLLRQKSGNSQFKIYSVYHTDNQECVNSEILKVKIENNTLSMPITGSVSMFNLPVNWSEEDSLIDVLNELERHAIANGVKKLSLRSPASFSEPMFSAFTNAVFRRGFSIDNCDIGYFVPLDNFCFEADFRTTRRKIARRLERTGHSFHELPLVRLNDVYTCIYESRKTKGYPVTMTERDLELLTQNCKERVRLFGVENSAGDIIASAYTLLLDRTTTYVFYWGERDASRKESPVTYLAKELFLKLKSDGYKVCDLGTSTVDSVPNKGLMRFKREVGGLCYTRIELSKAV